MQRVIHGVFGGGGGSPRWYQLGGGGTSALDVGAPVGSDVYSPVDGTVVAIRPFVVEGKAYGSEIDIQPQTAPSLVVAVYAARRRPGADGRHAGRQRRDEARPAWPTSPPSSGRRWRATRTTPGNHVTVEVRTAPALATG